MIGLIVIVIDNHLAIRFPVAIAILSDHCRVAGLVLLDYRRSVAISLAVILANRHTGSNRANANSDADIFRACRYCGAYARRCYYCQYVFHEPFLSL
jgi:hypothetical protein